MRSMVKTLATALGMALLVCGVASADTVTTNFEPPTFHPGSVNGQDGWMSATNTDIPALPNGYDQEVVVNSGAPAAFGTQSLRMSNRYTEPSGEFKFQTYSKPTGSPAGETLGLTEFVSEFSFISKRPGSEQPGLALSVSPDSGEGSRMSYVGLRDTAGGIRATIFDTPEVDGDFVAYDGGLLDRAKAHTIKFWIKLNPGEDNDLVRIFIDGRDIGRELGECFTTWENYYRTSPEQSPPPNVNTPANIDRLQLRSSTPGFDAPNGGFLFDNVTTTTANGPGPAACPGGDEGPPPDEEIVVDKDADTRAAAPGEVIRYRITVTNRGDAPAFRLRVCDRPPRALRLVLFRRPLRRASGHRVCLAIRRLQAGESRTFRVTFQLRANVTASSVVNDATVETPGGSAPSPVPPATVGESPRTDTGNPPRRRVRARDSARVRVQGEQAACPATVDPRARAAC